MYVGNSTLLHLSGYLHALCMGGFYVDTKTSRLIESESEQLVPFFSLSSSLLSSCSSCTVDNPGTLWMYKLQSCCPPNHSPIAIYPEPLPSLAG